LAVIDADLVANGVALTVDQDPFLVDDPRASVIRREVGRRVAPRRYQVCGGLLNHIRWLWGWGGNGGDD